MTYVVLWCQAVLVGVFAVSLATKVRGRAALAEFVSWVATLRLLPRRWSRPVAYVAVATEAGVVILLVTPPTRPLGFGCAAVLLSAFTVGIVTAIGRGQRAPCRCFGASTTRLGPPHVVRNLALVAVSAAGLAASSAAAGGASVDPVGIVIAVAGAAAVVLLVLHVDDLVALFAAP